MPGLGPDAADSVVCALRRVLVAFARPGDAASPTGIVGGVVIGTGVDDDAATLRAAVELMNDLKNKSGDSAGDECEGADAEDGPLKEPCDALGRRREGERSDAREDPRNRSDDSCQQERWPIAGVVCGMVLCGHPMRVGEVYRRPGQRALP